MKKKHECDKKNIHSFIHELWIAGLWIKACEKK